MLANSFSFMPVKAEDGQWRLLSDANLAVYLRENSVERKKRMSHRLRESGIDLNPATFVSEKTGLADAALVVANGPVLVHHEHDPKILVGILTAFDLL